jgi:hypothetical protein
MMFQKQQQQWHWTIKILTISELNSLVGFEPNVETINKKI